MTGNDRQERALPTPAEIAARNRLFTAVNLLLAGQRADFGLHVSADCLVGCVAVVSPSLEEADDLIDRLVPDLKERLRLYWDDVAAAKATGETSRPAGNS